MSAGLSEEKRDLLRAGDPAAVVGAPDPVVYAHMRDRSREEFQKTRNTKVLYSVGAKVDADAAGPLVAPA